MRCIRSILTILLLAGCLASAAEIRRPSILVLPFDHLGDAASNAWIGRAIQQNMQSEIARDGGFEVIGRVTLQDHRADAQPPASIDDAAALRLARDAGARYVVFGGYRVVDGEIRITGQVVEVASGESVGFLKVNGTERDLLTLEDKLADQALDVLAGGEPIERHDGMAEGDVISRSQDYVPAVDVREPVYDDDLITYDPAPVYEPLYVTPTYYYPSYLYPYSSIYHPYYYTPFPFYYSFWHHRHHHDHHDRHHDDDRDRFDRHRIDHEDRGPRFRDGDRDRGDRDRGDRDRGDRDGRDGNHRNFVPRRDDVRDQTPRLTPRDRDRGGGTKLAHQLVPRRDAPAGGVERRPILASDRRDVDQRPRETSRVERLNERITVVRGDHSPREPASPRREVSREVSREAPDRSGAVRDSAAADRAQRNVGRETSRRETARPDPGSARETQRNREVRSEPVRIRQAPPARSSEPRQIEPRRSPSPPSRSVDRSPSPAPSRAAPARSSPPPSRAAPSRSGGSSGRGGSSGGRGGGRGR